MYIPEPKTDANLSAERPRVFLLFFSCRLASRHYLIICIFVSQLKSLAVSSSRFLDQRGLESSAVPYGSQYHIGLFGYVDKKIRDPACSLPMKVTGHQRIDDHSPRVPTVSAQGWWIYSCRSAPTLRADAILQPD